MLRISSMGATGPVDRWTMAGILCACTAALLAEPVIELSQAPYSQTGNCAIGEVIETPSYRMIIVPELGGRVVEWIDLQTGHNVIYDNGYGGLLDDHGEFLHLPYDLEWLERTPETATCRLTATSASGVRYEKSVTFFAERSVIEVNYHIRNGSQGPHRLLFRNVLRPRGAPFDGSELYCFTPTAGESGRRHIVSGSERPAAPWWALFDPASTQGVAVCVEGHALQQLYAWADSRLAPTFEFTFKPLPAGQQIDLRCHWLLTHGLPATDYAHRNVVAAIDGKLTESELTASLRLLAPWQPLTDLQVQASIVDLQGQTLVQLPPQALPVPEIDVVEALEISSPLAASLDFAVLSLRLESEALAHPLIIDQTFSRDAGATWPVTFTRPARIYGEAGEAQPIPGWQHLDPFQLQPNPSDIERGYLVCDPTSQTAGKHIEELALDLGQNEQECIELAVHALSLTGAMRTSVAAPPGISVVTLVPEPTPVRVDGELLTGLKLIPSNVFGVEQKLNRRLFLRVVVGVVPPGQHDVVLSLQPNDAPPVAIPLHLTVHAVRLPSQAQATLLADSRITELCTGVSTDHPELGDWDEARANRYLQDLADHGVRGHTLSGRGAPTAAPAYALVRDRAADMPLREAIAADPARFRVADLPRLDFSYWNWLMDRLMERGTRSLCWPMGMPGSGFNSRHAELTRLIYGRALPSSDPRHRLIQDWYDRELYGYMRDRGMPIIYATTGGALEVEDLAWWPEHARQASLLGLKPILSVSTRMLASDKMLAIVAPFAGGWLVGDARSAWLQRLRHDGTIGPGISVFGRITGAGYWQKYSRMRLLCGLQPAALGLDGSWLFSYSIAEQQAALVYHTEASPIASAAWEGCRDGHNDGNYYRLARRMIAGLPEVDQEAMAARLVEIVGTHPNAIIRFGDRVTEAGLVTVASQADTGRLRQAKRELLRLLTDLAAIAPVQPAAINLGDLPLIAAGKSVFRLPRTPVTSRQAAAGFLVRAAGKLAFELPDDADDDEHASYPILFAGTTEELASNFPDLAAHPAIQDLDRLYPATGSYVLRQLRNPQDPQQISLLLLGGDAVGVTLGLDNLARLLTAPPSQYSHCLPGHWQAAAP